MSILAVNTALYSILSGTSALTALVSTKIYLIQAPGGTAYPYVIFGFQGGGEEQQSTRLDDMEVVYRVVGLATSNAQAGAIDAAIRGALHTKTLTVTGWTTTAEVRRGAMWQLVENVEGIQVYQQGAMYRIRLHKATG